MEGFKDTGKEGISQLKREVDSLDDFEHLGHDSSPLNEVKENTGDLLGIKTDVQAPARDLKEEINKRVETVGSAVTDSFDPLKSDLLDKPLVPQKMDSNLLDMDFPDRKEADAKLDKFLQTIAAAPKPTIRDSDKYNLDNIKSFMDNERGFIQEQPKTQSNNDLLDRYSDSEPEEDDFKPSKYEDFPKKHELPESFGSTENFKTETFKDVNEVHPELPKKDYPAVRPSAPAPEPPKPAPVPVEPVKEKAPEPIREKTPEPVKEKTPQPIKGAETIKQKATEPVKEKTPEPVKEKTPESVKKLPEPIEHVKKIEDIIAEKKPKIAPADAEAIFCKMGLGKSN
ncbi:hypothetical protein NQ314_016080 [Rhamnusium bicolor]|uniref:Uncharacterized protein n=1 Tax=Rhamnusium bicolor TaxID=1586634 RepID=A0AAV8WX54_9CUCU|nr:hypothetical protein NQ314_016080 [Rhamnusium bicolor]